MDKTGQLDVVKKMLHSVMVSSPELMTLQKLSRDYKEMVGAEVPYRQLGFGDLENFLRCIPDIVKVTGSGPMAFVQPLSTAQSAHIQKFVKGQKKTSKHSKIASGRKPKFLYNPTPSDLVFINESVRKAPSGKMYNPVNPFRPQMYPIVMLPNYQYLNQHIQQPPAYVQMNNFQSSRPIIPFNRPQMKVNPTVYPNVHPQGMYSIHKYTQPIRTSTPIANKPPPVRTSTPIANKPPPVRTSTPMENKPPPVRTSTPMENKPPPERKPTERVRTPSPDLDAMVKAVKDLSLAKGGDAPTGETKAQKINVLDAKQVAIELYSSDDEKVVVEQAEAKSAVLELDKPRKEKSYDSSSDDCIESEAFPAYAVDQRVLGVDYPHDAVRSDYKMPRRDLEKALKVDERYFLQLVEVTNPHSFYFWIYDDYDVYQTFSHNMQQVYKNLDSGTFTMPQCLMTPGHLCVVCPSNSSEWERAKIVSQRTDNLRKTIEVELIDTGVIDTVYTKDVKFLMDQFASMPPQGIPGRLAYVSPVKSPRWSSQAVAAFKQQVSYRRLFGKVEAIKNNIAHVVLVDEDSVNLNLTLINCGLVRRCLQT
ncbi:uncharacterized protein LOC111080314 [Drosophila obscura]|uniref:uncharacterized protein LOC111080314 n=1 Tax=Drosophila obscura TaxID=7282 RepID=UPI001BB2B423|nr:uncharacterized protein LOC111080314 [Drosophila obscura]